jgi:NO-binding membrane sensor protein with MHYT domain
MSTLRARSAPTFRNGAISCLCTSLEGKHVLITNNFAFGLLTPVLAYLMSCVGGFIGLRLTTRAFAYEGGARVRWLLLAAVSIGVTGIWVMHFIGMLGYSVAGQTVHFNVAVTVISLFIAVLVVFGGLLIIGLGQPTNRNLIIAGVITGIGVAAMHYVGMAAIEMQATMKYSIPLVVLSVIIGIVAASAALWAALRLRGLWSTLGASLIFGVGVSALHYTGVAAMQMDRLAPGAHVSVTGPTAAVFLLPLLIGIGVISVIMSALLVFSPTEAEIREDAELMARINAATARLTGEGAPVPPAAPAARWGSPGAQDGADRRLQVLRLAPATMTGCKTTLIPVPAGCC